jgi:ribosomal protein L11 methyltransferase
MIQVYSIAYPAVIEKEEFVGLFFELDNEGMEEKEASLDIYLNEHQLSDGDVFIREICDAFNTQFVKSTLENKNWNEQWESSFQPILIEDFVYVRATFHEENKNVQHEIIIEPKMSFGTGHHPTTAQMMQNMHHIDFKNKSVLDCGSGTGILAILAEKLGANHIVALDNDEWCYHNCKENIELNAVSKILPEIGELELVKDTQFDIILANIHRNFHTAYMHEMSSMLVKYGFLLVSGFYEEDVKIILDKALEHNLIANYHTAQHNWACIVLQKYKHCKIYRCKK